jgi:DUF1680 family protein
MGASEEEGEETGRGMPAVTEPLRPVPFTDVVLDGPFWGPRLGTIREVTIPYEYEQCKQTGRIDAFRLDWRPGRQPKPHYFWDSDVAKWLEAASYALATHPEPGLRALVDEVAALIASAQQPDGYLNTYFTVVEPEGRWQDLRDAHELYCAGHLIEAGVAHSQATGSRLLLDAVCRYADHIARTFGRGPGQLRGYCGHEEIELALVRLWRATGERRYLDLARYFVDERGQEPYYFDVEQARRGGTPGHAEHFMRGLRDMRRYNQSHAPVRQQGEAVGHAVRAMYLYCAMADLAREADDAGLRAACERLWQDVTGRHMYVTGGVGSSAANEGFTADYDLPNATAYAETCANVGLVFWAHRMLQLDCDGRYGDVLERALYNAVLSGVSLDGRRFFYANPLASDGRVHRQPWFGCACCPPNVARLLASLGQYAYSASPREVAVHLYGQGAARLQVGGVPVTVEQETDYPWDGRVLLRLRLPAPARFALRLRLPGWCRRPELRLGGRALDPEGRLERGYVRLEREWADGDAVELDLPMPVERVYAHPAVAEDVGSVALQRGPLVYCLEGTDHPGVPLGRVLLPREARWVARPEPAMLGGVVTLEGTGLCAEDADFAPGELYRCEPPRLRAVPLRAVPYFAWDNREPGEMRVWIREAGPA